ncbi:predicted protein [Plenodomus lingam JN3]|uniref:Predicted protein n=1 Tax=Leptosphaeria maculans (strain JN3 / isolate v23.1.3 / race Av1-4-5-6-7-8) TaxID=985895 RepID=E4ZHH0_LEPMJ|nr:predicted protein [Plenodomus lingam JN3]CBX90803.1 predicted protein [Plenodomus lingam JN3]
MNYIYPVGRLGACRSSCRSGKQKEAEIELVFYFLQHHPTKTLLKLHPIT